MKNILLLLLLQSFYSKVFATDSTMIFKRRNTLFIEADGKGPYYSVNYGRIFRQGRKLIFRWRAGFSLLPHDLSVPPAVSAFTRGLRHHFEFGIGLTPYLKDYKTFLHKPDLSDKQICITPDPGYRFQRANGNFLLTAGIDPLIFIDTSSDYFWNFKPEFRPPAHVAFGLMF